MEMMGGDGDDVAKQNNQQNNPQTETNRESVCEREGLV